MQLIFPHSLHYAYKGVPIRKRIKHSDLGYLFFVTTKDSYMQRAVQRLQIFSERRDWGTYDAVSFILAFVQSLPNTSNSITTGYDEYTRFPLETLVDGGGDCEDTSILFITLIRILGYDSVFIDLPRHLAVGLGLGKRSPENITSMKERDTTTAKRLVMAVRLATYPKSLGESTRVSILSLGRNMILMPEGFDTSTSSTSCGEAGSYLRFL